MRIKKLLSNIVSVALAISTLTSIATFSTSADDSVPQGPMAYAFTCDIYYQLRESTQVENGTDVRFVGLVRESQFKKGVYNYWITQVWYADDPSKMVETSGEYDENARYYKAYRSLIANGKELTANEAAEKMGRYSCNKRKGEYANEEYVFLISPVQGAFQDGDIINGTCCMLGFADGAMSEDIVIGA